MENLTNKQREIIRLAFTSKDPDLRRRAVARVVTARYSEAFLGVVLNQRFQNPETGNMVTWKSLPTSAQTAIYSQWEQAQEARGEGGGGARDEGGADRGRAEGDTDRGQRHADRTELYSTRGRKTDGEKVEIAADDDLRKLAVPSGMSDAQKEAANKQLDEATFGTLKKLQKHVAHALDNKEGEYMAGLKRIGYTEEGLEKLSKGLKKEIRKSKGKKFHENVLQAANSNDLEEVDADVLEDFRRDKPDRGRHLSWPELFQKFLSHRLTKPETKERMRDMSLNDFKSMYLAILKDEDEEVAVTASRRASPREKEPETARPQVTIFDPPSIVEKQAALTAEGRRLIRAAFRSTDPEFRAKLVRIARAELKA